MVVLPTTAVVSLVNSRVACFFGDNIYIAATVAEESPVHAKDLRREHCKTAEH